MLTPRDLEALEFIRHHKAAPLDVLGALFFARHPTTGAPSKHPAAAAASRLSRLQKEGYVSLGSAIEKGRTKRTRYVTVTRKFTSLVGKPPVKGVHGRSYDHHFASLRELMLLKKRLEREGYVVHSADLEHALRGRIQGGRRVEPGDAFGSFPDAAITATAPDGQFLRVAVEYVTSKYTDLSITEKAESFNRDYAGVRWVTDSPRTAAKVERLVGQKARSAKLIKDL